MIFLEMKIIIKWKVIEMVKKLDKMIKELVNWKIDLKKLFR